MGLVALIRLFGVASILYLSLLLVGLLSREEFKQSNDGMQIALARAHGVVRACVSSETPPEIGRALVVYLAIEDYFRPRLVREVEFFVATISAYLGFEAVKTIGIGQISKRRFESVNEVAPGADRRHLWISRLRDDCESVRLLGELVKISGKPCDGAGERYCALQVICLWHANHPTRCFKDEKHLRYIRSAALWYEALANSNTQGAADRSGQAAP